jgi:lysozyme family protein
MAGFRPIFDELISVEGGYSNDPDDPGGETKYGISKRQYPHIDIANLTLAKAFEIYYQDYWHSIHLDLLDNVDLACELFEQGVNFGQEQAIRHLQVALCLLGTKVDLDGVLGPITRRTANRCQYPDVLLKILNCLQFDRYRDIVTANPVQKKNFRGWLRRVELG